MRETIKFTRANVRCRFKKANKGLIKYISGNAELPKK